MILSFKHSKLHLNGMQEGANINVPDFSSTMVPLPATYEAAFVSPSNNTTLHMFSRYSAQILVTKNYARHVCAREDTTFLP